MPQWLFISLWVVHLGLVVWALIDLFKNPRFEGALRWVFAVVIVVFVIFGPLMYLVLRTAEPKPRYGG